MRKVSLYIILISALATFSCLKKVDGKIEETSLFDEKYDGEPWFKQLRIDSVLVGGSVYRYILKYEITHPQLLNGNVDFKVGVRRNDSEVLYGSTKFSGYNQFRFDMFSKHRVNGVFCHELGLEGQDKGIITASFYDCFQN